ncbi:MAG TPA: sigma 54-interacting transcriptional regulator [Anaeromyxobacteraceae bacterium]|nr:sigma 54-interacting transcriptional regulator [Anaeromyxobacteraceae bacterium]
MRVADLDLRELLQFEPDGGPVHFAGRRVVLYDAVALGLFRQELIDLLGTAAARILLARFGYAHGWRAAEALRTEVPWDADVEWRRSGGRLHQLLGHLRFEAPPPRPGVAPPFAEAIWRDSYEAEQHLLHRGRSDEPVCWTLTGFASGYLSYVNGREILCREERCVGAGDTECRFVGRPREDWEREAPEEAGLVLATSRRESLEASLQALTRALHQAERRLAAHRQRAQEVGGVVARSAGMRRVLDLARRLARSDATVLVTGESGVGKERVARFIHDASARAGHPFVAVSCGAIPETLIESELFGHARGAFTGASGDRPGLFEAAHGGTLFLDEVGELPLALQPKLLRAIQEREVRRVGETRSRPVDLRLITATNRALGAMVEEGRFRADLYYRLKVIEVHVPPLRERREDVLPLARRVLAAASARGGRALSGLSPRAADQLVRHDWPGNVRELENAMERAAALAEGARVDLEDLPEEVRAAMPVVPAQGPVRRLDELERDYVLAALRMNGGHRARTAAQLGVGEATLYRKLRAWGAAERGRAARPAHVKRSP